MLFNVWVTQDCNLSCKYCYEKEKSKKNMSLQTADTVIEFILKYQTDKTNQVNFHGGEPLLNWDVIEYIIRQINQSSLKKGRFRFSFTTNGILLTNDILCFSKEKDVLISISVDGKPETHDKRRVDRSGKGTYHMVEEGLRRLDESEISYEIRMTYDSETISELACNVKFLLENFDCSCLRWAPDYFDCGWNEEKVQIFAKQYQNIIEYQKEIKRELAEKIAVLNRDNFNKLGKCCGGITEMNIDTSGDLYPCTFACGNEAFLIGNIREGPDVGHIDRVHNTMQKEYPKCLICENKDYCVGNRCKMINYIQDICCGNTYIENLCKLSNAEIILLRKQWML